MSDSLVVFGMDSDAFLRRLKCEIVHGAKLLPNPDEFKDSMIVLGERELSCQRGGPGAHFSDS